MCEVMVRPIYFCVRGVSGYAIKFFIFCMTSEFAVSSNVPYMDCSSEFKQAIKPEAEFSDIIGTKVVRVFLLTIQSHLY
jgi:hypothetical protein